MSTAPLPTPPSLHEVEAYNALERATGHNRATASALDEASNALLMAGADEWHRHLAKLVELQRFVGVRLELLTKRVAGGA